MAKKLFFAVCASCLFACGEDLSPADAGSEISMDSALTRETPDSAEPEDSENGMRDSSLDAVLATDAAQASSNPRGRMEFVEFSINTQDFMLPEESIAYLTRIIDLHDELAVPVDVFLADEIARAYESRADGRALLGRFVSNPLVTVNYHIRPPRPYFYLFETNDWAGLDTMTDDELRVAIEAYETHAVDPESGAPLGEVPGGYAHVADLVGYPPYIVGAASWNGPSRILREFFAEQGARFLVQHGESGHDLGEVANGLFIRPEHVELKIYDFPGGDPEALVESAFESVAGTGPIFLGVKIHDNNFFASQSAWTAIYGGRSPPYDLSRWSRVTRVLDETERAPIWQIYEDTVRYVAAHPELYTVVGARELLQLETSP